MLLQLKTEDTQAEPVHEYPEAQPQLVRLFVIVTALGMAAQLILQAMKLLSQL